jgi:hypothetical protein
MEQILVDHEPAYSHHIVARLERVKSLATAKDCGISPHVDCMGFCRMGTRKATPNYLKVEDNWKPFRGTFTILNERTDYTFV